jgi:hypothetical protein
MPTELLIAFIAFVVLPLGLMTLAVVVSMVTSVSDDLYQNSRDWGSQDYDRRKK